MKSATYDQAISELRDMFDADSVRECMEAHHEFEACCRLVAHMYDVAPAQVGRDFRGEE